MSEIKTDDLLTMEGQEGLVLQGCGGDLQEWVDGINDLLTEAGILRNGSVWKSEAVSSFEHNGCTNLLFPFKGVDLDTGKLTMWRLQTHDQFGGTWLSDYVHNQLGGFAHEQTERKPPCPMIGRNGNIYNLMSIASKTLRENGLGEQAQEMVSRITGGNCHSYDEALCIISEYVEPVEALPEQVPKNHKKARKINER